MGNKNNPIEQEFFNSNKIARENSTTLVLLHRQILEQLKEQTSEIKYIKNTNVNKLNELILVLNKQVVLTDEIKIICLRILVK